MSQLRTMDTQSLQLSGQKGSWTSLLLTSSTASPIPVGELEKQGWRMLWVELCVSPKKICQSPNP